MEVKQGANLIQIYVVTLSLIFLIPLISLMFLSLKRTIPICLFQKQSILFIDLHIIFIATFD